MLNEEDDDEAFASFLPKTKSTIRLTSILFLGTVVLASLLLTIYRVYVDLIIYRNSDEKQESTWYFLVIFFNTVFMVYLAFDAVTKGNAYELFSFVIASIVLCFRSVSTYTWGDQEECPGRICLASLILTILFQVIVLLLIYPVIRDMGWKFYLRYGTSLDLKRLISIYQLWLSIYKLDLFFAVLLIFTGFWYMAPTAKGAVITVIFLFLEAFWDFLGFRAVRRESMRYMIAFLGFSWVNPAYAITFAALAYTDNDTLQLQNRADVVRQKILGVLFIGIIARVFLIIASVRLAHNFGKGLADRVFGRSHRSHKNKTIRTSSSVDSQFNLGSQGGYLSDDDHIGPGGAGGGLGEEIDDEIGMIERAGIPITTSTHNNQQKKPLSPNGRGSQGVSQGVSQGASQGGRALGVGFKGFGRDAGGEDGFSSGEEIIGGGGGFGFPSSSSSDSVFSQQPEETTLNYSAYESESATD